MKYKRSLCNMSFCLDWSHVILHSSSLVGPSTYLHAVQRNNVPIHWTDFQIQVTIPRFSKKLHQICQNELKGIQNKIVHKMFRIFSFLSCFFQDECNIVLMKHYIMLLNSVFQLTLKIRKGTFDRNMRNITFEVVKWNAVICWNSHELIIISFCMLKSKTFRVKSQMFHCWCTNLVFGFNCSELS